MTLEEVEDTMDVHPIEGLEEFAERVGVFDCDTSTLALMRQRGVCGVAKQDDAPSTPARQGRDVHQRPKAEIVTDVSDEVDDSPIPSVGSKHIERILDRSGYAVCRLC